MRGRNIGIVADDLTGAMDSIGYLAAGGLSAVVVLDRDSPQAADVVVVNTDSRCDPPATASEKARRAARALRGRAVFKKIDSTLRGNIGAELTAVMDELACEKAIVAPAFPSMGRTTVGGTLLVNGVPVTRTQFAHDPVTPVTESHIPRLLERSTAYRVASAALRSIAAGVESLYREMSGRPEDVLVCDAVERSDLRAIAGAAAMAEGRWLLCGSGGLARELQPILTGTPEDRPANAPGLVAGPALLVVGSRHPTTAGQLRRARDELGVPLLNLDVEGAYGREAASAEVKRIVTEAGRFLGMGRTVAVTTIDSPYVPARNRSVRSLLAESVAGILAARALVGLFICGGDTAVEVCRTLGAAGVRVFGEIKSGIPAGEFIGGHASGARVVTKAGGFGGAAAIVESMPYLESGHLS